MQLKVKENGSIQLREPEKGFLANIPEKKEIKKWSDAVLKRLLEIRPEGTIVYRPFEKSSVFYEKRTLGPKFVDLKVLYPNAKVGNVCYVGAVLNCVSDHDLNLWIWGDVVCHYNGKIVYDYRKVDNYDSIKGEAVKIHVQKGDNDILFMCRCNKDEFEFSFMPSIPQYKWWIKDYIFHSRITSPIECFRHEDGVGISRLYESEQPFDGDFVYPAAPKETGLVDFSDIFTDAENGDICYALTYALADCTLRLHGESICVFVNGTQQSFNSSFSVNKGDEILVKCGRSNKWSFEFNKDSAIGIPFLHSARKKGDKWLVLGTFGSNDAFELPYGPEKKINFSRPYLDKNFKKIFWRFADKNLYLRPYMDTCFFAQWFYANMVASFGMLKSAEIFGYKENIEYFFKSMQCMAQYHNYCVHDEELFGEAVFLHQGVELNNLDSIGTIGINMIEAYKIFPDSDIMYCIELLCDAIKNNIPRFEDGTYRRPTTMWADDTYMSCPFLIRLGLLKNDESFFEEVLRQLRGFKDRLYMEDEGIYSHIYFLNEKTANRIPWGRGNGWIFNTLSDACVNIPDSFSGKSEIINMFKQFAYALKPLQDENGLWHQVINHPESYAETSCSAMFLLGIARGINCGILKKEDFFENAVRAYNGIVKYKLDTDGNVYDVCMGSGCSMELDYYKQLGVIQNDVHGTGIVLAAFAELYKMLDA